MALGDSLSRRDEVLKAHNEQAIIYYVLGDLDSSRIALEIAIQIAEELQDSVRTARLYANLGNINRSLSFYREAIEQYSNSLNILEKLNDDPKNRADVLNNIGLIYEDVGMNQLALEYIDRSLEIYQKVEVEQGIGNIWLNRSAILMSLGHMEQAQENIQTARSIHTREGNIQSLQDVYHTMAQLQSKLGADDSALYYIQKTIDIQSELNNPDKLLSAYLFRANYQLQKNNENACQITDTIVGLLDKVYNKETLVTAYRFLYRCAQSRNQPDQALKMLEMQVLYQDSVRQESDRTALIRTAIQGEYDLKLFKEQLQNEKVQSELELRQLQRVYTIIIVGILLIFGIFLYARQKARSHRREKEQLLQEIRDLKVKGSPELSTAQSSFSLDRESLEEHIARKLNETDWNVLNVLLDDPVMSNKDLAEQVHLSVDGLGSSLRRMYDFFEIKESKYKKISLIMEAMKISNGQG